MRAELGLRESVLDLDVVWERDVERTGLSLRRSWDPAYLYPAAAGTRKHKEEEGPEGGIK